MRLLKIIKGYPLFNYKNKRLSLRLSSVFLTTGVILSGLGFSMGVIFSAPLSINLPNFIMMMLCIILPIIVKDELVKYTEVSLYFVGGVYFPFLFFTNGGLSGGTPF